jgi:phage terminase large subunit-like protein
MDAPTATSAAALAVGAPECLHPEPEWVRAAADDHGFDWVRRYWRRAAAVPGAWFDTAKADKTVALWPRIFKLTIDRFASKPFRLSIWQDAIVRLLIGWKVPNEVTDPDSGQTVIVHVRLFRQLRLWIPRKNGKTEFLAALALLFFLLEGVVAGEGYVFARDEDQAAIPFARMKAMISYAPGIAKRALVNKKSIWIADLRAAFVLLTGRGEGKHGKSPTVILGDEMHEWETMEVMNNLRQGTGARLQPIELYASTAGLKTQAVGLQMWDESLAIDEGRTDDPTTLVVIFAAGEEEDWTDEKVIAKANPSLGLSPTIAFIRRELSLAKDNPRREAHFRRYHLNQWVEQVVRWLNRKKWEACSSGPDAWKGFAAALAGRKCYGAADVSKNFDFTATTFWFPPIEGEKAPKILSKFWLPEETIAARSKSERIGFDRWAEQGAIIPIPGGVIDLDYVLKSVVADFKAFDVQLFGWDPWNAQKLYTDLVKEGISTDRLTEVRQGHRTLGTASADLERRVYAGDLDHGSHPVLNWMAGHCAVRFDENMNFVPAKKASKLNIDGIVTAVMADALCIAAPPPPADLHKAIAEGTAIS